MRRTHITALAPRSGTTLLFEMMAASFGWDGLARHEMHLGERPDREVDRLLTKSPGDLFILGRALRDDPVLQAVIVLRDPRDVIVSRHRRMPGHYWTNMVSFRRNLAAYEALRTHPRVVIVRYERLVLEPDDVQRDIEGALDGLVRRTAFSNYVETARPTPDAERALGSVRPVSTSRVGAWRDHLPRMMAQERKFGPIGPLLDRLGYRDPDWPACLSGVAGDNGRCRRERLPFGPLLSYHRRVLVTSAYGLCRMGFPPRAPILDGTG